LQKFALLITPEDKQQIKTVILFIGNQTKTFPQIWYFAVNRVEVTKKHISVQLQLAALALSYPFWRAARLNYFSPSTMVALENALAHHMAISKILS